MPASASRSCATCQNHQASQIRFFSQLAHFFALQLAHFFALQLAQKGLTRNTPPSISAHPTPHLHPHPPSDPRRCAHPNRICPEIPNKPLQPHAHPPPDLRRGAPHHHVAPDGHNLSTDSECPSHSDFDILRSSIYRMGKMGGGSRNGTPRTDHSVPAGHSDELQLPDQIPF